MANIYVFSILSTNVIDMGRVELVITRSYDKRTYAALCAEYHKPILLGKRGQNQKRFNSYSRVIVAKNEAAGLRAYLMGEGPRVWRDINRGHAVWTTRPIFTDDYRRVTYTQNGRTYTRTMHIHAAMVFADNRPNVSIQPIL